MIWILSLSTQCVLLLHDHRLVKDDIPANIFSDFDLLSKARIRPPQVCEVAHELQSMDIRLIQYP
jgi:hypothetical protein